MKIIISYIVSFFWSKPTFSSVSPCVCVSTFSMLSGDLF